MTISFRTNRADGETIGIIAERAYAIDVERNGKRMARSLQDWRMDITAVHANGNPLRLTEFASADNFNFLHDAFGIYRHLDRDTGKLTNHFRPRFSQPMSDEAAKELAKTTRAELEEAE